MIGMMGAAGVAMFPYVVGYTQASGASATSFSMDLPDYEPGDYLLFLQFKNNSAGTLNTPSGFTSLGQTAMAFRCAVFYRQADGSEGASFTAGHSGDSARLYRGLCAAIRGATAPPEMSSFTTASGSTTVDPANLSPSWGTANTLWLPTHFSNAAAGSSGPTLPSGYTNEMFVSADGNARRAAAAYRASAASSENPGVWTFDASGDRVASTIAFRR